MQVDTVMSFCQRWHLGLFVSALMWYSGLGSSAAALQADSMGSGTKGSLMVHVWDGDVLSHIPPNDSLGVSVSQPTEDDLDQGDKTAGS